MNKFKKLNKKGTDKILSVYWFTILFIVAAGVFYMAVLAYGEPYDVRDVEANFLINQIADCLTNAGKLNYDLTTLNNDNILAICHLNLDVEDTSGWNNNQHYFEISYKDFSATNFGPSLVNLGNVKLKSFCNQGEQNPVCVERKFYAVDDAGQSYVIKIFSLVRKTEKNDI
jgi:hypothetical protein